MSKPDSASYWDDVQAHYARGARSHHGSRSGAGSTRSDKHVEDWDDAHAQEDDPEMDPMTYPERLFFDCQREFDGGTEDCPMCDNGPCPTTGLA